MNRKEAKIKIGEVKTKLHMVSQKINEKKISEAELKELYTEQADLEREIIALSKYFNDGPLWLQLIEATAKGVCTAIGGIVIVAVGVLLAGFLSKE